VETKIFVREPMGFIGALVVPLVVFIVLGRVLGAATPRAAPRLDMPFNPAIVAAVIIALGASSPSWPSWRSIAREASSSGSGPRLSRR
jgi:hypothetical protein